MTHKVYTPDVLVSVQFLVNGTPTNFYRRSDGQLFVAVEPRDRFVIRVYNAGQERYEVIVAVDGHHVLKNEPGHVVNNRGMIVGAMQVWLVDGWRLNDRKVAEFVAVDPQHSVAAQATGSDKNVGIIGIAVYKEQLPHIPKGNPQWWGIDEFPPTYEGASDAGKPVLRSAGPLLGLESASAGVGAGMGDVKVSPVGRTTFERDPNFGPRVMTIRYNTRQWLIDRGIIPDHEPSAFPGSDSDNETGYRVFLPRLI